MDFPFSDCFLSFPADFDLFLVHFPIALAYVDPAERYPPEWFGADGKTVHLQDTPMQETWQAMEELVDAGQARNIGLR